jgi:DNA-binding transcriptional MerR regulator
MADPFNDGKEPGALRTIGELGEALGIKAHVLRYWEDQFPMLMPLKRSGGRRYYRPDDVALVKEIDRLVNREGYTIRGARAALKDHRATAGLGASVPAGAENPDVATAAGGHHSTTQREAIDRLKALRSVLAHALEA